MNIIVAMMLYIGLMTFVYNTLVLFRLIGQSQVMLGWYRYLPRLLKALCFIDNTKKVKSCVLRLWVSIGLLSLTIVLGINQFIF